METSTSIAALAAALSKAQAEMEGATKDQQNPHFRSKFASLASCWEACRVPLAKNGLSVVQSPSCEGKVVTVTTLLAHGSGEWVRSALSAEARDGSPQSVGSAISYLRRYSLTSIVGISPEDDDGEQAQPRQFATGAEQRRHEYMAEQATPPPKQSAVSKDEFQEIADLVMIAYPGEEGRADRLMWWARQLISSRVSQEDIPEGWSPSKAYAASPVKKRGEVAKNAKAMAANSRDNVPDFPSPEISR